jgi:hypothetical protein
MKVIALEDYDSIKSDCQTWAEKHVVFYRGTKVNYLLPSIVPNKNKLNVTQLSRIENKLLEEFKFYYTEEINEKDIVTNDWLYRIKSREHGLANRLMDWSHTFYKALDFATYNVSKTETAYRYVYLWIIIIEPEEILNLENYKNTEFAKLNNTVFLNHAVPASQIELVASHRQTIQGGGFLVQPSYLITTPVNQQSYFQNKLLCIQIPIEHSESIRRDIILKGGEDVNKSILFKDDNIDSICQKINQDYLYAINNLLNSNDF